MSSMWQKGYCTYLFCMALTSNASDIVERDSETEVTQ